MNSSTKMDPSKIPALSPPSGVISNFDNPTSQASTILGVNISFITLMTSVVGLRVLSRGFVTRTLGWDDYTCFFAAGGSIAHTGLILSLLPYGYGVHMWDVSITNLLHSNIVNLLVSTTIVYGPTIFFAKISILFLYLRLFSVLSRMRHWIYFGFAFLSIFYTAYTAVSITYIFLCTASNFQQVKYCLDYSKILYAQGALNVSTDLVILCLPIKSIWNLQISQRRKVGVFAILMAGSVACTVSIVRLILASVYQESPDVTWTAAKTSVMTAIEINIGIICGCLPALSALFRHYQLKGFHPSTLQFSGIQYLRRIKNTIIEIVTPPFYRKPKHLQTSQMNPQQMLEKSVRSQGELMMSNGSMHLTDRSTPYDSNLVHTTETRDDGLTGPFKKIRGMTKGRAGPVLVDPTNNTSLGVQIDRSLGRIDSEMQIGSVPAN